MKPTPEGVPEPPVGHITGPLAAKLDVSSETAAAGARHVQGDVRDQGAVEAVIRDADVINHLAGQVAVTSSVNDPRAISRSMPWGR